MDFFNDLFTRNFVDTVESISSQPVLTRLSLYPIKSCRGIVVKSWPLTETGLLYDRHFMLVDPK